MCRLLCAHPEKYGGMLVLFAGLAMGDLTKSHAPPKKKTNKAD